ncbi:MAG: heparinase II/III family protein [Bacteroidales bacterium]|nr:heparinase II/III family protein [Bacteroidales bacterium]
MKKIILTLACCCMSGIASFADSFDYGKMASHPRLVFTQGMESSVRKTIGEYKPIQAVHQRIMSFADETLREPTVFFQKEGKRLLGVSRFALKRITHLAYAYRMTGDERYARRALQELKAVSRFESWNPSHFLDTGEMTMAVAIGYDWLFDWLTPKDKEEMLNAVVTKAFDASDTSDAWFYTGNNNWNSVCNAGLVFGALAFFENIPDRAKSMIEKSIKSNLLPMQQYAPDGGYPEGYTYWGYGTTFQVMLIEGLFTALGSDAGLSESPGFMKTGRYMQYMTGPSGISFNFSDCGSVEQCNTAMFWFSRKLNDPTMLFVDYAKVDSPTVEFEEDQRLLVMLPILASQQDLSKIAPPTSPFWCSRGTTPVFIYRGGWESKDDTYLAIKGGTASAPHAHMDAGTFVFEKYGVRWAMDFGAQNYYSLESKGVDLWNGSQDSQRWDVFRYGNKCHNTLTVNGQRHNVKGFGEIVKTYETKTKRGAEIDLTTVFQDYLASAVRTAMVDLQDNLVITDKLRGGKDDAVVTWTMVTPAEARIVNDNTIELTKDGKKLLLKVKSPAKVEMKIWTTQPDHDYDSPNPGTLRVGFEAKVKANANVTLVTTLH